MRARDRIGLPRRPDPETGQATTEFALILFPLLVLVAGIIQFGIGLNFFLDGQRIANQGARWAAVNCGQSAKPPAAYNPCAGGLENTLRDQALSQGLAESTSITICFPEGRNVGDPVTVRLTVPFDFVPIVSVGSFTVNADATMRLEQTPALVAEVGPC